MAKKPRLRKWISTDVETDGPVPGIYSMIEVGAVLVDKDLNTTFHGTMAPQAGMLYQNEALAVTKRTHEQTLQYPHPRVVIAALHAWLTRLSADGSELCFISDNVAFDWQFINYYLHFYMHSNPAQPNPFGFRGYSLPDLYAGVQRDIGQRRNFKRWRKTPHTHNALDDARGNAEAFIALQENTGFLAQDLSLYKPVTAPPKDFPQGF